MNNTALMPSDSNPKQYREQVVETPWHFIEISNYKWKCYVNPLLPYTVKEETYSTIFTCHVFYKVLTVA